jgi:hypothetical protein
MGDILGSIFGTSSTTTQTTQPDAVSSALNQQRLQELVNLLSTGSLNQFSGDRPDLYTPTDESTQLIRGSAALAGQPIDYSNLLSLDDYKRSFDPVTDVYSNANARLAGSTDAGLNANADAYNLLYGRNREATQGALARSYADYGNTRSEQDAAYAAGTGDITGAYNAAIQRGDYDLARAISLSESSANRTLTGNEQNYQRGINLNEAGLLRSLGLSEADTNRSLATQDANRARALQLGLDATGGYVDQIARPRLEQVMALQGLERGAALPAAIARAVAEQATPYLQSIENTYGTNQANTLNALTALQGQLTGDNSKLNAALTQQLLGLQSGVGQQRSAEQAAAAQGAQAQNAALGSQRVAQQGNLASGYQNNIAQLAQALMANNISLEQAGITANSALGQQLVQAQTALRSQQQAGVTSLANTYGGNAASFAQSLPGASTQLTLAPIQARAGQAAIMSSLQPLADFPRQLKEADFLRRQGLFTTAYTGIPYTPGGTVTGGSATGNIFDQLGGTISSGVTGGQGGFSTIGTKT